MQVMKNDTQVIDKNFMDKQIDFIKNKPIGIHTGFVDLDYQWGGLKKGDTYLIAARPAMGKTAFILNMMLHMAIKEEKKVALFSLEQSKEMIVNRMLAIDSRVEGYLLRKEKLEDSEWEMLVQSAGNIANSNLIINDTPGIDVDSFDRELSSDAMKGVEVVFIDYLQLLTADHAANSRQMETYLICERIKQIAVKHDVAVIVLSQLSRSVETREDHRPLISDFRDKKTANYFDNVSFIYRDEYYDNLTEYKGIAEIITARNKYGSRGVVNLAWLPEFQKFCNLEKGYWEDEEE